MSTNNLLEFSVRAVPLQKEKNPISIAICRILQELKPSIDKPSPYSLSLGNRMFVLKLLLLNLQLPQCGEFVTVLLQVMAERSRQYSAAYWHYIIGRVLQHGRRYFTTFKTAIPFKTCVEVVVV